MRVRTWYRILSFADTEQFFLVHVKNVVALLTLHQASIEWYYSFSLLVDKSTLSERGFYSLSRKIHRMNLESHSAPLFGHIQIRTGYSTSRLPYIWLIPIFSRTQKIQSTVLKTFQKKRTTLWRWKWSSSVLLLTLEYFHSSNDGTFSATRTSYLCVCHTYLFHETSNGFGCGLFDPPTVHYFLPSFCGTTASLIVEKYPLPSRHFHRFVWDRCLGPNWIIISKEP